MRKAAILQLGSLDFVSRAENLVFIGETGVGKTGLASGLLLKDMGQIRRAVKLPRSIGDALRQGYECRTAKLPLRRRPESAQKQKKVSGA